MPAPRATGYCLNVEERDACLLRRRFQAKDCRLPAAREANARVRAGDHPSFTPSGSPAATASMIAVFAAIAQAAGGGGTGF